LAVKASVTRKGAVLLGKYVACDGFHETRPLRVVTHAHADHLIGLRQSLKHCERVLMTPATKDLIDVMRGPLFLMMGNVETLTYNQPFRYGDEVENVLVSLVEQGLREGTVYVFGYHGKIQEVMQILRKAKIKVPFVAPEKVFHVSKVCEKHGMRLGTILLSTEDEGRKLLKNNSPCVAFYHMGSRHKVGQDSFRVCVSGWEFRSVCRRIGAREYVVALSDHSDFEDLLEYVRRCRPKEVITDNYRVGDAVALAREIWRRLKIPAKAVP